MDKMSRSSKLFQGVGVGVVLTAFISVINVFTEGGLRTPIETQLDPMGPMASKGGSYQNV